MPTQNDKDYKDSNWALMILASLSLLLLIIGGAWWVVSNVNITFAASTNIWSSSGSSIGNFIISPTNITAGMRMNLTANILIGQPSPYTYNFLVVSSNASKVFNASVLTPNLTQSVYFHTKLADTYYINVSVYNATNSLIGNSSIILVNVTTLTPSNLPGNWLNAAGIPNVQLITNGYLINNITQDSIFYVQFGRQEYIVTDNFISPDSTGLTINGQNYPQVNSTPIQIGYYLSNTIYLKLLNITWYLNPYLNMSIYMNETPRPIIPPSITTSSSTVLSTTLNTTISSSSTISSSTTTSTLASTSVSTSLNTSTTIDLQPGTPGYNAGLARAYLNSSEGKAAVGSNTTFQDFIEWVAVIAAICVIGYLGYRKVAYG